MKKSICILFLSLFGITSIVLSQSSKFRSGIFLHHSTGGCIWGPNDSNTSVPQQMAKYNTTHGLSGDNAVTMNEQWWPGDDNEWATWHSIFDSQDHNNDIQSIIQNNKIVVIKSCFPCSNIDGIGSPADTLDPTYKTIYNYKWHWRSIVKVMAAHPENFFVIRTNTPLVANDTDNQQACLSDQFCYWVKNTLATGNDPVFGAFPTNVYVFDFFHKLANRNGKNGGIKTPPSLIQAYVIVTANFIRRSVCWKNCNRKKASAKCDNWRMKSWSFAITSISPLRPICSWRNKSKRLPNTQNGLAPIKVVSSQAGGILPDS